MGRDIAAFLTGLIIIAVVFVLVNPNSQGPAFVKALGAAIANMLSAAAGNAPAPAGGTTTGGGTQTAAATGTATTGAGTGTPSRGSVSTA